MDYREQAPRNPPETSAAHHEAGHVVVASVLGATVKASYIITQTEAAMRGSRKGGYTCVEWDGNEGTLDKLIYLLGGYAAEEVVMGHSGRLNEYPEEWQEVRKCVREMGEGDKLMQSLLEQAKTHVRSHLAAVKAIANELLRRRSLNATSVKEITDRFLQVKEE